MGIAVEIIKCPHCGKKFVENKSSKYKLRKGGKIIYYCGYNCWVANDTRRYNYEKGRYSKT